MRSSIRRCARNAAAPLEVTPRQRAALLLVDLIGYSSEQAERILRVRPSTVRVLASWGGLEEGVARRSAYAIKLYEARRDRGTPLPYQPTTR